MVINSKGEKMSEDKKHYLVTYSSTDGQEVRTISKPISEDPIDFFIGVMYDY